MKWSFPARGHHFYFQNIEWGKRSDWKRLCTLNFRGMSWTDLWKTHPTVNFRILGRDTDRFQENSSKYLAYAPILYKNSQKLMDEFSRNRSRSYPGNWNIEKILDEFSRNSSVSHPGKLKFRKKFWMSFPGFANKALIIRVKLVFNGFKPILIRERNIIIGQK